VEGPGDAEPDPGPCPGDEHHVVLEVEHSQVSSVAVARRPGIRSTCSAL
jgi:hypothetical protein